MAHCNDRRCTRSTRYESEDRFCDCDCEICKAATKQPKARGAAGTCDACSARIGPTDEFCDGCGARISDEARKRALTRANDETYARNIATSHEHAKVTKAAGWIGGLALVFAVSGIFMWLKQSSEASQSLRNLSSLAPDQVFTYEGVDYKVAALRSKIESLPTQLLVVNLTLAAIFGGLFLWGKRSPLPAIATALAVFVVVHLVNFVLDPSTIVQGIIIKVIAIGALATGLRAALTQATPVKQSD
jgi:hypothetical protein